MWRRTVLLLPSPRPPSNAWPSCRPRRQHRRSPHRRPSSHRAERPDTGPPKERSFGVVAFFFLELSFFSWWRLFFRGFGTKQIEERKRTRRCTNTNPQPQTENCHMSHHHPSTRFKTYDPTDATVTDNASHSTAFSESQVSHCQPFSQLLTAALMITLSKGQSLLSAKMCLAHKNQKNNNVYKSVEIYYSGLQFSFQTYFVHWVRIHTLGSAAARESRTKAHCHAAPNSQALTLGSQVLKGHCKKQNETNTMRE